MAGKMTKAELDAYFAEVTAKYSSPELAVYFSEDVKAILKRAADGSVKSLKVEGKRAIYDEIAQMSSALETKIDGYLAELKSNLTSQGASSHLGGAFYYSSREEGEKKARNIIGEVDSTIATEDIVEKAKGFGKVVNMFSDYVNNSKLIGSLDEKEGENAKKNKASLSRIYKNSIKVEKILRYRDESSEIYKLLDTPDHTDLRTKTAAPFKYYTILAGIKTGKIKSLTPEHIVDLQWVYQNNKGLFPKNFDMQAKGKDLKSNPQIQKELFDALQGQHDDQTIREELLKHKQNLISNHEIMAVHMDDTRAFKVGQNTLIRNLKRGAIVLGASLLFGGVQAYFGVMSGMADPTFSKVMGQMFADGKIWNTLMPAMIAAGADVGVNGFAALFRNKPFNARFNEVNRPELIKYLYANRSKWNVKDKAERKEFRKALIAEVNARFNNVLGYGRVAERNLDTLMRGIAEQERQATRRERRANSRRRGEGVELIDIQGKRNIESYARNIGLSADNPLTKVMGSALERLGITLPKRSAAFADKPAPVSVDEQPAPTPVVEKPKPAATTGIEADLDEAILAIKNNIQEEVIAFDTRIGDIDYEIRIERVGAKGKVKLAKSELDGILSNVRTKLAGKALEYTTSGTGKIDSKGPKSKILPKKSGTVRVTIKKKSDTSNGR